jgi:hypothetical protein
MTALARFTPPAFALAIIAASPGSAGAQISCGTPSTSHSMRQTPGYLRSVDVVAVTSRPMNSCPLQVQTEAWVDNLTTTYINTASNAYSASVSFTRAVPSVGTWHSTAKHWLIWFLSGIWQNLGNTFAEARVVSGVYACQLSSSDCAEGYEFKPQYCSCVKMSPILLDTAGDGYRLTSADEGVVFDIDANGMTAEKIAWPEAGSDDGWLVLERSGNGQIDSGEDLKLLEGPSYGVSTPDGIIDSRDQVYARLRLWFDRNHNGVSEADELTPLPEAGVLAISSEYKENARRDQYGNRFSLMGKALFRGPQGQEVWRNVYDVYLTVAGPSTR